jgi:hypothetical protein
MRGGVAADAQWQRSLRAAAGGSAASGCRPQAASCMLHAPHGSRAVAVEIGHSAPHYVIIWPVAHGLHVDSRPSRRRASVVSPTRISHWPRCRPAWTANGPATPGPAAHLIPLRLGPPVPLAGSPHGPRRTCAGPQRSRRGACESYLRPLSDSRPTGITLPLARRRDPVTARALGPGSGWAPGRAGQRTFD